MRFGALPFEQAAGQGWSLRVDEWLTAILERPAFHAVVAPGCDARGLAEQLASCPSTTFCDAKVPTADIELVTALERSGFGLVDTNMSFDRTAPFEDLPEPGADIRFVSPNEEHAVASIAEQMDGSRFHLDPVLRPCADALKASWARNFFRGDRGTAMVVAAVQDVVVAFLQLLGTDRLTIDLVAVDQHHRRRGLAGHMIAFAARHCGSVDAMNVGTQVSNLGALRLYDSLGFRPAGSSYVFHFHRD